MRPALEPPPLAPRVLCLQHSERVRPLSVSAWARQRGVELVVVRVDQAPLPAPDVFDRVIVLGGGMNTDEVDAYPWLDTERAFLRALVARSQCRVFGICLGSQLLAEVLGGSVERAQEREIGWQQVKLTSAGQRSRVFGSLPAAFDVMQWHGDSWVLPPSCALTASSVGCSTQAFEWGDRVFAVQFHPEFTYERTCELAATTTDDLTHGTYVQSALEMLAEPARFDPPRELLFNLLDRALLQPT